MGAHKLRVHAHYGRISGQKKTVRLVFRLYSWAIFVWVFQILPLEKDKGSFPSLLPPVVRFHVTLLLVLS